MFSVSLWFVAMARWWHQTLCSAGIESSCSYNQQSKCSENFARKHR